jgi:hypothetical protein
MNERTMIAKIRVNIDDYVHAAIVREGPFTATKNAITNLYLSHFSQDETETSPIVYEEMESCMEGIFKSGPVSLKKLDPSEIRYFSSPEKLDSSSGMIIN